MHFRSVFRRLTLGLMVSWSTFRVLEGRTDEVLLRTGSGTAAPEGPLDVERQRNRTKTRRPSFEAAQQRKALGSCRFAPRECCEYQRFDYSGCVEVLERPKGTRKEKESSS